MRRVVVTGLGAITPIGNNIEAMWESVQNGVCGIAPITQYDTSERKVKLAGEVKDYNPEDYLDKNKARKMSRFAQFAVIASNEAIKDAGINIENEDATRCGIIVSSGIGGLEVMESEDQKGLEKGYDRVYRRCGVLLSQRYVCYGGWFSDVFLLGRFGRHCGYGR